MGCGPRAMPRIGLRLRKLQIAGPEPYLFPYQRTAGGWQGERLSAYSDARVLRWATGRTPWINYCAAINRKVKVGESETGYIGKRFPASSKSISRALPAVATPEWPLSARTQGSEAWKRLRFRVSAMRTTRRSPLSATAKEVRAASTASRSLSK